MDKKRIARRYWGIFSTIVVAIIFCIALLLVILKICGFSIFTIMSGSMEPKYHVGSLIFVQKVEDTSTLQKGDVITFMASEDTIVTHRIDEVLTEYDESTRLEVTKFRTKGDANDSVDGGLTHYKNVLGKPIFSIPLLGYLAAYIQQPPGLYIALIIGTILAASAFLPDRSKRKEEKRK